MDSDSVREMILTGSSIAVAVIAVIGVIVIGNRVWDPMKVGALAIGVAALWFLPLGTLWVIIAAYVVKNRAEESMRAAAAKRWHAEHGSS